MSLPLTPEYFVKLGKAHDEHAEEKPTINSPDFFAICDKFEVEPSDLEDSIRDDDLEAEREAEYKNDLY